MSRQIVDFLLVFIPLFPFQYVHIKYFTRKCRYEKGKKTKNHEKNQKGSETSKQQTLLY